MTTTTKTNDSRAIAAKFFGAKLAKKIDDLARDIREAREAAERHTTAAELANLVGIARAAAAELSRLAGPAGILYARHHLDDVRGDLDYLYAMAMRFAHPLVDLPRFAETA